MPLQELLAARSGNACELCGSADDLQAYDVPPEADQSLSTAILACAICREQLDNPALMNADHWRCLGDSMWSEVDAVKIVSWRVLDHMKQGAWAQELLDIFYAEDATLERAKAGAFAADDAGDDIKHLDCNGVSLSAGDSVTLIKDLTVKGAGFTAKRGTTVRGISLVSDNAAHIEGRVNGQQIVILTEFVKRAG